MDLRLEAQRLREAGSTPPTDESRQTILAALSSKFEGIQAVAAEVLGKWRDESSKQALRGWFLASLDREHAWAVRSVAMRELAPMLTGEDTGWVLNLYFGAASHLLRHELLALTSALPANPGLALVSEKARDSSPVVRHAALMVIARSRWGDPAKLLRAFANDPDPRCQVLLHAWGAA